MFEGLLKLRGKLSPQQRILWALVGFLIILLLWILLTAGEEPLVNRGALPTPLSVLLSYGELYKDNALIKNTFRSLGFNLGGYVEAILLAIPLGFLIGLVPLFRSTLQRPIDAIRYVPLPAAIGLFIAWFGLGASMKVHFLAFGIFIYLLPVVVQRIDEVKDVYLKTVYTLGATDWQMIKSVYFPSVISRLSDDIRVLTAISWTYIIIAESIGGEGGIGALIWRVGQRQGRIDKVFALLILIMIIGMLQDKLFVYLDKKLFPYKYQGRRKYEKEEPVNSTLDAILDYAVEALVWVLLGVYFLLFIGEFFPVLGDLRILSYLFGDTVWVVHFIVLLILGYRVYDVFFQGKGRRGKDGA